MRRMPVGTALWALLLVAWTFVPQHRALAQGGNDPLAKVPKLLQVLGNNGFEVLEGKFFVLDTVNTACAGNIPSAWYNNVQPYLSITLPGSTKDPVQWETTKRVLQPASYLLRQDEALLVVGSTPPPMAYFSFQTFLLARYNEKTESYDPKTGGFFRPYEALFSYVGDTMNSLTVQTTGSSHYNSPMALISTGHRQTLEGLRAALLSAGFPAAILNTETLPPSLVQFGYNNGDQFLFLIRTALPVGGDGAMQEYQKKVIDPQQSPMRVFRVRPKNAYAADPLPTAVMRTRGTGHTEMDLFPTMQKLRQKILERYRDTQGFVADEIDTTVPVPEGYPTIQRDLPWLGPQQEGSAGYGRDSHYLASSWFDLPEDGFAIVYGVNHAATGKATYSSVSAYVDETLAAGVSGVDSGDFATWPNTASDHLPGAAGIDKFYVWKVARSCKGELHCVEVTTPCEKIAKDAPVRIGFRAYLEPGTRTGASDAELIYDRVIVFRRK